MFLKARTFFPKSSLCIRDPLHIRVPTDFSNTTLSSQGLSLSSVGNQNQVVNEPSSLRGERCWDRPCGLMCACMHCSLSWGAQQSFQHQNLAHGHFFHLKRDVFLPYWTTKELSDIYFDGGKTNIHLLQGPRSINPGWLSDTLHINCIQVNGP